MARSASFWREVADLSLVYLVSGAVSVPFLVLLYFTINTAYFRMAIVALSCVVVVLIFGMNFLERRIRLFSRHRAKGAIALQSVGPHSLTVLPAQPNSIVRFYQNGQSIALASTLKFEIHGDILQGPRFVARSSGGSHYLTIEGSFVVATRIERSYYGNSGKSETAVGRPQIHFVVLASRRSPNSLTGSSTWGIHNVRFAAS